MSFSADWLALRAPADARARADAPLAAALEALQATSTPLIVDLGAGSGATWRALADRAPHARWRFVDHDAALLARASRDAPAAETRIVDLADIGAARDAMADADLVTASAFFDLVGSAWLDRFLDASPPRAAFYAALTYGGEEAWSPTTPDDERFLSVLHAHMRGDKGFGPALGPDAGDALKVGLSARREGVLAAESPWDLSRSRDGGLMDALAAGSCAAVAESDPALAERFGATPRATAVIRHLDVFAGQARAHPVA